MAPARPSPVFAFLLRSSLQSARPLPPRRRASRPRVFQLATYGASARANPSRPRVIAGGKFAGWREQPRAKPWPTNPRRSGRGGPFRRFPSSEPVLTPLTMLVAADRRLRALMRSDSALAGADGCDAIRQITVLTLPRETSPRPTPRRPREDR